MTQHTAIVALSDATHNSPGPFTMPSSLDRLVDDIVLQILQALPAHAVLSLRWTSRRYHRLSQFRCVWYTRFCADVLARNLPLPGPVCALSLLSAAELEQRTLRALYLERTWPRLAAKTLVSVSGQPQHQDGKDSRVDQVVFIPGGTDVLTVQGDKVVHWLIVSWPGLRPGTKHVGEWTPFEGLPCRIIKDGDVPGVMAVGPRDPWRSPRFAKVFSTSLRAPFVTLRDYADVPGVVAGIWRHLILVDTTKEPGGGLELLNWHAQTTGTALLPHFPDLYGCFLDFVVFTDHILVAWECCVSVFPVPRIPTDGRVVVEHIRVFMFQEAISRPVGFTTCVARRVEPPSHSANASLDPDKPCDMDCCLDWDGRQHKQDVSSALGMLPTLTIAGRLRRRPNSISMVMLAPLVDEEHFEKRAMANANTFPYRLVYVPPHGLSTVASWQAGEGGKGSTGGVNDCAPAACTALRLGWSGRGVFVVGRELRLVSPGLLILPPYEMQLGPVFETGDPPYLVDRHKARDADRSHSVRNADLEDQEHHVNSDQVDFDEGMGRLVVAKGSGGFEVVRLE